MRKLRFKLLAKWAGKQFALTASRTVSGAGAMVLRGRTHAQTTCSLACLHTNPDLTCQQDSHGLWAFLILDKASLHSLLWGSSPVLLPQPPPPSCLICADPVPSQAVSFPLVHHLWWLAAILPLLCNRRLALVGGTTEIQIRACWYMSPGSPSTAFWLPGWCLRPEVTVLEARRERTLWASWVQYLTVRWRGWGREWLRSC